MGPGERDEAVRALRTWIATKVDGYLKVCDPYFGLDELTLVKWIQSDHPNATVTILTSARHLKSIKQPLNEAFDTEWRVYHSDMNPPSTSIIVASVSGTDGGSPVHDRWWITKGSGVRLGTSLNSLGVGKLSELSWPSAEEVAAQEAKLDRYIVNRAREHDGKRITYITIDL